MAKIVKTLTISWQWSGDKYSLQGFNLAITPATKNPKEEVVAAAFVETKEIKETYSYKMGNITLDKDAQYKIWVQAVYENSDSDWVSTGGATVTDDGSATIITKTDREIQDIVNMASDNILTRQEKVGLRREWQEIVYEFLEIESTAISQGIPSSNTAFSNFKSKGNALGTYLNGGTAWTISSNNKTSFPLWINDSNLGNNTSINGNTYRETFRVYYEAKVKILEEINKYKVNNVQVGGVNLLVGTATSKNTNVNVPTSYITWDPYTTHNKQTLEQLGFKVGDKVTVGFDWSISKNGTNDYVYGNFRVEFRGIKSDGTDNQYLGTIKNPADTFSSSNTKGRVEATVALDSTTIKAHSLRFRIDNSVLNFKVSNLKMERGTKATGWSPAPEDVEQNVEDKINNYDTLLNQQKVFNKLTNNGATQGIYLQNGKVYLNGEYIKAGTITADMIKSGTFKGTNFVAGGSGNVGKIEVNDNNNNLIFRAEKGGVVSKKITFLNNVGNGYGGYNPIVTSIDQEGIRMVSNTGTGDEYFTTHYMMDTRYASDSISMYYEVRSENASTGGASYQAMREMEVRPDGISFEINGDDASGSVELALYKSNITLLDNDNDIDTLEHIEESNDNTRGVSGSYQAGIDVGLWGSLAIGANLGDYFGRDGALGKGAGWGEVFTTISSKGIHVNGGVLPQGTYNGTTGYTSTPQGLSIVNNGDTLNGFHSTHSTVLTVRANENRQFQIGATNNGSTLMFRSGHVNNTGGTGTGWTSWRRIYHEGSKPTCSEIGAIPNTTTGSGNLNICTDSNILIRADRDNSSTSEYVRIQAGLDMLTVYSNGGASGHTWISGGNQYFENNKGLAFKNTSGTDLWGMFVSASNNMVVGDNRTQTYLRGSNLMIENAHGARRLGSVATHGGVDLGDTNVKTAISSNVNPTWWNGNTERNVVIDTGTYDRIYTTNWFRSKGSSGWYCEDYGGGWHMTDTSWMRCYNNKSIYTGGEIKSGGSMTAEGQYVTIGKYEDKFNAVQFKRYNAGAGGNILGKVGISAQDNGPALALEIGTHASDYNLTRRYVFSNASFTVRSNNAVSNGSSAMKWTAVYATNGTIQTSDERFKVKRGYTNTQECYELVKNTPIYNYISLGENKEELSKSRLGKIALKNSGEEINVHMGIMAQDIQKYECSKQILVEGEYEKLDGTKDTMLHVNPYNLTSAIMGALQVEIQKRELLEEKITKLESLVEQLMTQLVK